MVPDRDYYVDKDGKLTEDPAEYARQIGVKGCFLADATAQRYGIVGGGLVSVDEPAAPRRMMGSIPHRRKAASNEASVKIEKAAEKEVAEKEESSKKPQEPAGAKAEKPAAKKEKKQ